MHRFIRTFVATRLKEDPGSGTKKFANLGLAVSHGFNSFCNVSHTVLFRFYGISVAYIKALEKSDTFTFVIRFLSSIVSV